MPGRRRRHRQQVAARRRSRSPARARRTDRAARARAGSRPSPADPDASAHTGSWSNEPRRRSYGRHRAGNLHTGGPRHAGRVADVLTDRRAAEHDARGPRRDAARPAEDELERHGFEGVDIEFDAPSREWSGQLSKPTVNLFLYDLREAESAAHRASGRGPRSSNGRRVETRPPMVMECSYAVTAWTQAVEDEHRLLSQVLAILFAYPAAPRGAPERAARRRLAAVADQGPHRAGQGREVGLLERGRRPVQGLARLRRAALGRVRGAASSVARRSARKPFAPRLDRRPAHGARDAPLRRAGPRQVRASRCPTCGSRCPTRHLGLQQRRRARSRFDRLPPGLHRLLARTADGREADALLEVPGAGVDLVIDGKTSQARIARNGCLSASGLPEGSEARCGHGD